MEVNIEEQEAKLMAEAQVIGGQLAAIQEKQAELQQAKQLLVNKAQKNQGGLDLLKNLNGKEPEEKRPKGK